MRYSITIFALIISFNLHSQAADKIKFQLDSLTKRKTDLENDLRLVTQAITNKTKLLTELQTQEFDKNLTVKVIKDINVLDSKSIENGKKIFVIKKNEEFTLLNFENDFYFIDFKNMKGYVYYVYLNGVNGVDEYKAFWIKRNDEKRKKEKQNDQLEQKTSRLQRLTEKFGADNAYKIINKKIWLGMTDSMARESIGSPDSVNRSTYSSGTKEQWIYKDKYLYFENGVLTSWQDEK